MKDCINWKAGLLPNKQFALTVLSNARHIQGKSSAKNSATCRKRQGKKKSKYIIERKISFNVPEVFKQNYYKMFLQIVHSVILIIL